jgi:hypothetical protein
MMSGGFVGIFHAFSLQLSDANDDAVLSAVRCLTYNQVMIC